MGKRFVGALLAVMMLTVSVVGSATSVAAANYTCPDMSCAFTVPDSYSEVSNDATSVIFSDSASGGAFGVTTTATSDTVDDLATAVTDQFASVSGYQADPRGLQDATLGGSPAKSFYFQSVDSSGTMVETLAYFSVMNGKLYMLTFSTTPDAEDAFVMGANSVFSSWQFT